MQGTHFAHPRVAEQLGVTYDDLLLVPCYTEIASRSECDVSSRLTKNVPLKIPIVSSPMDSVTEFRMALEMARNGGAGIIHRYQTIEEQARAVKRIKKAQAFPVRDPYVVDLESPVEALHRLAQDLDKQSFLVCDLKNVYRGDLPELADAKCVVAQLSADMQLPLAGVITARDMRAARPGQRVRELMTPRERLTVHVVEKGAPLGASQAKDLLRAMLDRRIEKLPLVDAQNHIVGLATERDATRILASDGSNVDARGALVVGAAVAAKDDYVERAEVLIRAGVDFLAIDIANGHNVIALQALEELKSRFKIDVISANVATAEGAAKSVRSGADAVRCGIGSGSICSTRLVSGAGVPQVSALLQALGGADEQDVPVISDGGLRTAGAAAKALALGASSVMLGNLLAGTDAAPGMPFLHEGGLVKVHRGMAGFGANLSRAERTHGKEPVGTRFAAEGVEGLVPYRGSLSDNLHQLVSGIKSGMSYVGARDMKEFRKMARFTLCSPSSLYESGISVKRI